MDSIFKPPKSIVFNNNAHNNLETFLRSFEIYLQAMELCGKKDTTKIAMLLNLAGEEAQTKFATFKLTNEERENYEAVVKAFRDHCKSIRNETYERYKFFSRMQQEDEDFEHFLNDVKLMATGCNFKDLEESLIRDKIVSGIRDIRIQERLLQQSYLTREIAEDICRAAEREVTDQKGAGLKRSLVAHAVQDVASWKLCQETFCNRLRNSPVGIEQRYYIDSDLSVEGDYVVAILKTDQPAGAPNLKLHFKIYDDEIVHIFIDEDGPSKRYRPTIALAGDGLRSSKVKITNNKTISYIKSDHVEIHVQSAPFLIDLYRGDRLFATVNQNDNFVFETNNGKEIAMGVTLYDVHRAYGLPEHADHLALETTKNNGEPYRHFNLDYGHYQLESRESLYGTIGVLYGHGTKHSSGVFWLNAAQTWTDLNNTPNTINAFFMSESGIIDMFMLSGPTLPDAVKQYAKLTGTAPLPQYFTLGYHQSRYSYMTQDEVLEVVQNFEDHDMPVDVMWLDIDYTNQKMYFTWDPIRFSDPQGLLDKLEGKNRKLVAIIDPHIKVQEGYMVHDEATKQGYYVKNPNGTAFEGECWPGLSSYLDFLNPNALDYYSSLYSDYYFDNRNIHLWNDMNEPAVFKAPADENTMPLSAVHHGGFEHRDVHNIYGFYQTVGTKAGLLKIKPDLRPFILTRSHFAGIQRYAGVWTGDNAATWEYLQMSFPMCLTEALAGVSYCGADVGGFFEIPDDELYQRWYQAGAWLPFYRGHSTIDVPRREPYLFNEDVQQRVRTALYQRYAHLPLWYTLFYEHETTGEPVIRPIAYHYADEGDALSIENQVLVGKNVLAAPVLKPGVYESRIYLPGGKQQIWFNIDDNYKPLNGTGYQIINVNLDSSPVFYRAGSIIPRKDQRRQTTLETHQDPFTFYVCLDESENAEGTLYVDDYESFNYRADQFVYLNISFSNNNLIVESIKNTTYSGVAPVEEIVFVNLRRDFVSATLVNDDGFVELNPTFEKEGNTVVMKNFNGASLSKPFKIQFS